MRRAQKYKKNDNQTAQKDAAIDLAYFFDCHRWCHCSKVVLFWKSCVNSFTHKLVLWGSANKPSEQKAKSKFIFSIQSKVNENIN